MTFIAERETNDSREGSGRDETNFDGNYGAATQGETRIDTFTVEEAAERLRIGRNSAYSGVKNGQIPSIRIGRRLLVPRPAIEALLAGATAPSQVTK